MCVYCGTCVRIVRTTYYIYIYFYLWVSHFSSYLYLELIILPLNECVCRIANTCLYMTCLKDLWNLKQINYADSFR